MSLPEARDMESGSKDSLRTVGLASLECPAIAFGPRNRVWITPPVRRVRMALCAAFLPRRAARRG